MESFPNRESLTKSRDVKASAWWTALLKVPFYGRRPSTCATIPPSLRCSPPGNPRLERLTTPYLDAVRVRSALNSATQHDYAEAHYAARTWERERRVVIKAEVVGHPGCELKEVFATQ